MPLKVGDYVRFTCRCSKDCRRAADKNQILVVQDCDGSGVRLKYLNGKKFQNGYWFSDGNVIPEPFLGAVLKASRRRTRLTG